MLLMKYDIISLINIKIEKELDLNSNRPKIALLQNAYFIKTLCKTKSSLENMIIKC